MNNHDLGLFAATARLGSFTRAARSLSTVQSNVTARVKILEEELGTKLFHRNRRGVSLTPKGQELLPYAQQVVGLIQKAKEDVSGNKMASGMLRIGALPTTAAARLPGLLKTYLKKYKAIDLGVESGTTHDLTEKVLDRQLDGAFVVGPVHHPELKAIPVFAEEMVIAMPLSCRNFEEILKRGPIPKVLVCKAGCEYRRMLDRYFAKDGVSFLNHMEFGTLDGILGCVSAGLGVTMLPRSVIRQSSVYKELRIVPLPGDEGHVVTDFIFHGADALSPTMERFLEFITRIGSGLRPPTGNGVPKQSKAPLRYRGPGRLGNPAA